MYLKATMGTADDADDGATDDGGARRDRGDSEAAAADELGVIRDAAVSTVLFFTVVVLSATFFWPAVCP
jgi:hypothetical protein